MTGYLFAITKMDGELEVAIVSREYWEKEGCLDDRGNEGHAADVLESMGLSQSMESYWEPGGQTTEDALRKSLLGAGFEEEPEFTGFIQGTP